MANCGTVTKVGYFLIGAGFGAIVALLLAPNTGEDTRKIIAKKADDGKDYLVSKGKEFRDQAEDLVEKGKDLVNKQKDRLAEALEAGKETAKATFNEIGRR